MPRYASSLAFVLAILALTGAAGCGRKGALEPPPEQQLLVEQGAKVQKGVIRPKQSFPLDPLLN